MDASEPIIGIDLGTTNSVVATVHQGQPQVIVNRVGQRVTPSVVAVAQGGKRLVGQVAKRQAITNPKDTVYAAKRLIGRKFSSEQVQEARKILAYEVVAGQHDDIRVRMGGRDWAVPELSAMVLRELKLDAEAHFGRPVKKAIITVPAYFNDGQRQATKDAGKIAGLEVLRILNEPTAAALAYGFGKKARGKIAVFDLGGGTLDVSVLEVSNEVFEVVATGGDTFLGGEDFDNRIIGWLADDFARQHQVDLRQDRTALQRLKDVSEKAKIELSTAKVAPISLPFLYTPPGGATPLHVEASLTREKLEGLTKDLCDRAVRIAGQVLSEARVRPEDLKEVVLVGGMTRMPAIQEAVRRFFKREPCKGVNPDEVVALGAALHGASLTAREQKAQTLLLDVTPQSLRVAVAGGFARTLIPKNTTVPTSATQLFATSRDGQSTVHIIALQGEDEVAYRNELLGEFVLTGLREAPRGQVEIDVTFDINSEGLVSVSARDRETGRRQSITLMASGGLTPEELERILREHGQDLVEVKAPAEELAAKREELDGMLRETKALMRLLSVSADSAGLLQNMQPHVARGTAALAGSQLDEMKAASLELSRALEVLRGAYQRMGGR